MATRCRERSTPSIVALSAAMSSARAWSRSEEHTSELQSPYELVCRLLLEKKKVLRENRSGPLPPGDRYGPHLCGPGRGSRDHDRMGMSDEKEDRSSSPTPPANPGPPALPA